jgi:hypothetical protein
MESIIQAIRQYLSDPLVNLAAASILGLIPTLIDKLQKRINQIWWDSKSTSLQAGNFSATGNLRVTYKKSGKRSYKNATEGLSICRFVFWNSGKETLLDNNISSVEPLILYFGDNREILEIREVSSSNPSISFQLVPPNQIYISFEYLESKQGTVFDVIHTGESIRPYLAGKIKGGKINRKLMAPIEVSMSATPRLYLLIGWLKPAQRILVVRWFSTIFGILTLWAVFMTPTLFIAPDPNTRWYAWTQMIFASIIYPLTAIWTWKIAIVPVKLREFYSKIE